MDKAKGGKEAPDALVRVEDLADLMQRAVAVVREALSFASQHIPSTRGERLVGGGRGASTYMISPTEP